MQTKHEDVLFNINHLTMTSEVIYHDFLTTNRHGFPQRRYAFTTARRLSD